MLIHLFQRHLIIRTLRRHNWDGDGDGDGDSDGDGIGDEDYL